MKASGQPAKAKPSGRAGTALPAPQPIRPRTWLTQHARAALQTLGQMTRTPLNTLMTIAVIGIALALPGGLYALLSNVQAALRGWDGAVQISLFLSTSVSDAAADALAGSLLARAEISEVVVIPRARALEEYREQSGFADILDAFDQENPLPAVLLVRVAPGHTGTAQVQALLESLRNGPDVDLAQFDLAWLKRVQAITEVVRRGVVVLAVALALGVLLIVGNSIRLAIHSRHDEIELVKLVGGTDAFIRRPFLYSGASHGCLGGLLAWLLVELGFVWLREPVMSLARSYETEFQLVTFAGGQALLLPLSGALLGLAGSWLAVTRHLSAIEPA